MDQFKLVKEAVPTFTLQLQTLKGARVKIKQYLPVGEARKLDLQTADTLALGVQMIQDCVVEWNIVGEDGQVLPIDQSSIDLIPLSDFNSIIQIVQKIIVDGHYEEDESKKA